MGLQGNWLVCRSGDEYDAGALKGTRDRVVRTQASRQMVQGRRSASIDITLELQEEAGAGGRE